MEKLYSLNTILIYLQTFTRTFTSNDAKAELTELIQDQLNMIQKKFKRRKYNVNEAKREINLILWHTKINFPGHVSILKQLIQEKKKKRKKPGGEKS